MRAMMNLAALAVSLLAAVSAALAREDPAKPASDAPVVLSDGAGAQMKRVENMHETRFIEIFLAARDPKGEGIVAPCYNTMFTPAGIPASKDTAPQAMVEGLDLAKLKTEYGVLGASLNGPKIWMPDWAEVDAGKLR